MKRRNSAVGFLLVLTLCFCFPIRGYSGSVKEGKADSVGRDVPSSTKIRQKSEPVRKSSAKPSFPLTIVSIRIKNQDLMVRIGNTGAKLSPKDHALIKLKVGSVGGRLNRQWALSRVDPRRRLLMPKGRVDFNTGLKVTRIEKVTAELSKDSWNQAKQTTLSPGVKQKEGFSEKHSTPAAASKPSHKLGKETMAKKAFAQKESSSQTVVGHAYQGTTPHDLIGSDCFHVHLAYPGEYTTPGRHVEVHWSTENAHLTGYAAKLFSVTDNSFHTTIWRRSTLSDTTSGRFLWALLPDIPYGNYKIYVGAGESETSEGLHACHGFSRNFSVMAESDIPATSADADFYQVTVQYPEAGMVFRPASYDLLNVRWAAAPECIAFKPILLKDGAEVQTHGLVHYCERDLESTFHIREAPTGSDYQVKIELWDGDAEPPEMLASDTSEFFTIINDLME